MGDGAVLGKGHDDLKVLSPPPSWLDSLILLLTTLGVDNVFLAYNLRKGMASFTL